MISLIVVDYKAMQKTMCYIGNCYRAITDYENMHVIIVDNCEDTSPGLQAVRMQGYGIADTIQLKSSAAKAYRFRSKDKELLYICAGYNAGYARGNNIGAAAAREYYQDDYYLFSNNDLRFPQKFALQQLIEPMLSDQRIAVVGPRIVDVDGEQQSPRKKNTVWKQLFLSYYDMLLPKGVKFTNKITDVEFTDQSQKCYWVTGSFLLADAGKFHEVNGFDEETFLYCEEVILAEKLLKCGYLMYYESAVMLIHEHGQTVKSAFSAMKGISISFHSSLYYYKKYRNMSAGLAFLAQINFYIFSLFFSIKKALKEVVGRIGGNK